MASSYSNDGSGNQTTTTLNTGGNTATSNVTATEADRLLPHGSESQPSGASTADHHGRHGRRHTRGDSLGAALLGTIAEGVEFIAEHAQEAASDLKEAIVDGVESAQEVATEIKEAIVEEAQDVRETLVDNLVEKDDGESIIFEMGLTRNSSLLPSDIEEVAHPHKDPSDPYGEEHNLLTEVKQDFDFCPRFIKSCFRPRGMPTKKVMNEQGEVIAVVPQPAPPDSARTPFHAYATLLGAVICLSSIGPSLDMQGGVDASMKIYWRMTGTYMVLFPLAATSIYHMGFPSLSPTQWFIFLFAAACYATMCVCFVLALEFTSVGNAVIFSNSQSILLLVGKLLVGQAVSLMEGSGAFVAFSGGILCACDSTASTGNAFSTDLDGPVVWAGWGDILALMSAIGGVGYLIFAKTLREYVPSVFAFMFMIMFTGSQCVLLFLWASGAEFTFDRDINHGLWGFMHMQPDRLPLEIWMVCVCNLMGAMGYVRSMAYFDNLIISVATLMEPVVASIMAYALSVGLLPSTIGWVGNFLVAAGTVAVIYPNSHGKHASGGH